MKKGVKITIATLSVLGLSGLAYFIYKKTTGNEYSGSSKDDSTPKGDTNFIPAINPTSRNDNFPLKYGSYGERVKDIQKLLNKFAKQYPAWGLDFIKKPNGKKLFPLATDKDWGKATEQAINLIPKVPNEINEATYNAVMKYAAVGNTVRKRKVAYIKNANGTQRVNDFGAKPKTQQFQKRQNIKRNPNARGNRHEENVRRQMRLSNFTDKLFDNLFGANFKDPKLFKQLENLPTKDFIEINNMFNRRNIAMGNQRTLAYEIRGASTIDEENLLNRFDELNLS